MAGEQTDGLLPLICGEVTVWKRLSIEGCGNGAGFLHTRDVADMAHFRAKWPFWEHRAQKAMFTSSLGLGFTEVQSTADAPGFQFGPAENGQIEAAGPEISIGFSGRRWVGGHGHLLMNLTVGAAHISGAPEVMNWRSPTILFGSATMGFGF